MEKMVGDLQAAEIQVDEEMLQLDQAEFGLPRAPAGTWGSCLRIVDPVAVSRTLSFSASLRKAEKEVTFHRRKLSSNSI